MQYRNMGKTGVSVSPLGFGMMRLPTKDGKVDREKAIANVRWAIDHGLNYVDTAYNYHEGESELVVAEALKDGYREKVNLATKCPVWKIEKPEDFDALLGEQLGKLQTDHIDFYLLHALGRERWEQTIVPLHIPERMLEAKKAGKVKHIGFSFHDDVAAFKTMVDYWDQWDFCQIQLNYVDKKNQAGLEGLEYAASKGMGVVIMEPLRGGYLADVPEEARKALAVTGKTPVEMGLDFLWDRPEVSVVLSGMGTMEQAKENMGYAEKASIGMLTQQEQDALVEAETILKERLTIPCTGCNYCSVCPQQIPIPKVFKAYNDYRSEMSLWHGRRTYRGLEAEHLGGDCIGCGTCEAQCPQHLPISEWMPKIHDLLK